MASENDRNFFYGFIFLLDYAPHCASVIAFPSNWIILSHFEKEILISSY